VLPPDLLLAISARPKGRVAIVVGAGCSFEPPTSLPLSARLAEETHQQLMDDGVLKEGDCANPQDLSCVADAVFAATGQQRKLVERMGPDRFRTAEANEGYLLAAALLREQAVVSLLTLNFDGAMVAALSQLGADEVSVINGPEDHNRTGLLNVIYLHRNAWSDFEKWILRSTSLEDAWLDRWEELVAVKVLTAPVTVFAGLGSPAQVLLQTIQWIRAALPNAATVYQVDPSERDKSAFFAELGISPDSYLQMGWGDFMRLLSERVLTAHAVELQQRCKEHIQTENLEKEDYQNLCTRLKNLGLLGVGRLRAQWLLEQKAYAPQVASELTWIADLVLAIGFIERRSDTRAKFHDDGVVELFKHERPVTTLIVVHGRGTRYWHSIEAAVQFRGYQCAKRHLRPRRAVLAGVRRAQFQVSAPANIVSKDDASDILPGRSILEMVDIDDLRGNPALINDLVEL
jgi:hypothetical protein